MPDFKENRFLNGCGEFVQTNVTNATYSFKDGKVYQNLDCCFVISNGSHAIHFWHSIEDDDSKSRFVEDLKNIVETLTNYMKTVEETNLSELKPEKEQ